VAPPGYGIRIGYGEYERTSTANGLEKFGTYTRDAVGQDYAERRYNNSSVGAFWSPDPAESGPRILGRKLGRSLLLYAKIMLTTLSGLNELWLSCATTAETLWKWPNLLVQ
jgi:hypothetical protein